MTAQIPPPPPRRNGPTSATVLVGVGIVLIALAAAAGGAWWRPNGDVDRAAAMRRGLVGAGIALAVVAVVLAVTRRWWRALPRPAIVAAAALALVLGWLLGLSGAPPPDDEQADPPPTLPDSAELPDGMDPTELDDDARASFVDADGDGEPDRGADGNVIIALDADGDGQFDDGFLVPCEGQRSTGGGTGKPSRDVVVDFGCDGSFDGRVSISPELLASLPSGFPSDIDRPDSPDRPEDPDQPDEPDERPDVDRPDEAEDDDGDDEGGDVGAILKTLLIVAAIAAAAWLVVLAARAFANRRPRDDADEGAGEPLPPPEEAPIDAEAIDAALESSIETLLGSPDARVAIRAAYAVLLDALAEAGFGRLPYEAPEEHLTRCLQGLSVRPEPLRELVRLFAVARFSTHDVTEADRTAALDALRASQRELRIPGPPVTAGWAPPTGPA